MGSVLAQISDQVTWAVCLLSDVALGDNSSDTSSIRDEDVFYDAQSEISDSLALFNDASSYNAASIDSIEDSISTSAIPAASEAGVSTSAIPTVSEAKAKASALPTVSKTIASTSTVQTVPEASINTSAPTASEPKTNTPTVTITNEHGTFTAAPEEEEDLLDLFYDADQPFPDTTNNNDTTDTTNTTPLAPTTLHNIPLRHTITPIIPDLTIPPSFYRPRPAYPPLSGRYNIYALAAQGATIVDDPYRVLIGPLSPAARHDWRADCGRAYLRGKLGRSTSSAGDAGGGGGGGRDRGGRDRGGVVLCQMVRDDEGVWYVLAMFENQERAGEAVEFLHGFAW